MYTFNTKEADGQSLVHLINLMLGDNITGAEVGAATALTSCTLLQNCPSLKLYVIDAWKPFMDYIKDVAVHILDENKSSLDVKVVYKENLTFQYQNKNITH